MASVVEDLPRATVRERLAVAAAEARNWAICLVAVGLLFKVAWIVLCAADGALHLQGWEWVALPVLGSYQHLLFGLVCFSLYLLLLIPSVMLRPLRVVGFLLLSAFQVAGVLYFMTALRMALLLGTPPTFGLMQAGAQGGVLGSSMIRPENLPYTIGGGLLAAATVFASLRLNRRWSSWPEAPKLLLALGALALWVTTGLVAMAHVHSELHHAQTEPVSFLVREYLEQRAEREAAPVVEHDPEAFRVELLYGESPNEATSEAFHNLDRWRQTNRNVVLIILESVAAHNASYYGPVRVDGELRDTTPNIAALRDHMLLMENHYAVHPTSMEDLFAIACSLYPYPLRPAITAVNPRIPCQSMPEILSQAGYTAGLFHSGHFSFWRKDDFFGDRGFSVMYDADTMPDRQGAYEYNWGLDERVTAQAIAEFIREHRDEPFFVEYIPVFPHSPYTIPSEEFELFGDGHLDNYHDSLRFVDGALQIIFDALREEELMDDTLLIVVADHGEAFNEHPGNRSHSAFIYEENIHVPFGIHNPILFPEPQTISRVTTHPDILPTVADLLELERGPAWQGRSLLEDGASRLAYFFSCSGRQLVGLRDGRYKVIWNLTSRSLQLFDLERDPGEQHDLSSLMSDRVGPYQRMLSQWRSYQLALIPRFGFQRDGADRGVRWVADLRPARRYQPHNYDPVADHSVAGRDLAINGISHDHGVGMHADAWYAYDISDLDALRLVGRVGRDSRMRRGLIQASIFLDGRLAFDSGRLRASTPAMAFDLDVEGVDEVAFVVWNGGDTGRSDHLNWADLHLSTEPDEVFTPGRTVAIESLEPVGTRASGSEARSLASIGEVVIDGEELTDGIALPEGSAIRYDLRPLGATRITGRLFPVGLNGGTPPSSFRILFDGRLAWRREPERIDEPASFALDVPEGTRLLTLRTGYGEGAEPAVAELSIETSDEALASARASLAVSEPRVWDLALLPPASAPGETRQVGWARAPDGSWLALEGEDAPHSFWHRPGASLTYHTADVGARRLLGHVTVIGPESCHLRALLRDGDEVLWQSELLSPESEPERFEVSLVGHEEIIVGAIGEGEACAVVWAEPMLSPNEVSSGDEDSAGDGGSVSEGAGHDQSAAGR